MKSAIIAAAVALLVSATSATGAFIVTSKNIENGTIQTVDISAKAKRALKGNRGLRGLRGETGATGQPGPSGPQGVQGAPGLAHVTTVWSGETLVGENEAVTATAVCPAGQIPVSGGHVLTPARFADLTEEDHTILESKALERTMPMDGWRIAVIRVGGAENTWSRLQAVAYCVSGTND